ncbi:ureidoglycine aminohydrolase [Aureococcus anophagefferens]|nr:ureidoglycine aminohydrolase [Aureococcus anophagefferens]
MCAQRSRIFLKQSVTFRRGAMFRFARLAPRASRCARPLATYASPPGGHPPQSDLLTSRAKFTEAYAMIPRGVLRDIVTSPLPNWERTRSWILARPLSGFAETFSQYVVEVAPGGGSDAPEPNDAAEGVLFVLRGSLALTHGGETHAMEAGGFAFVPPGARWALKNAGDDDAAFVWVASDDLRHDMHCNIVTFQPGAVIPFLETHVMEHGLYVLEGKAVYNVNGDWIEVEAGDFIWMRAFCPQACYAGGPGEFRYLLYKDVNRHAKLPF